MFILYLILSMIARVSEASLGSSIGFVFPLQMAASGPSSNGSTGSLLGNITGGALGTSQTATTSSPPLSTLLLLGNGLLHFAAFLLTLFFPLLDLSAEYFLQFLKVFMIHLNYQLNF